MKSEVKTIQLGKALLSLRTGLNPRENFQLNTEDALNWYITVRELNGTGVSFLNQTDRVNDDGLKLINNRSNLEVGDVLFSGTGTIGKTAIVSTLPTNWNIKEGVYALKPNQEILHPQYLLYLLQHYNKSSLFQRLSAGSTVFSVPMQSLSKIKIQLPLLSEQRKLSFVLEVIDAKIELNNQINIELEQMTKTLYDYWFVQFDFPDKNGKPYKSSGGKMVWNEVLKREIPEGWTNGILSDTMSLEYGKPLKTENRSGNGYPVLGSNGIVGHHSDFLVQGPGIVIGRKGSAGEVTWVDENFYPIDTTYYVKDKFGFPNLIYHYYLLQICQLKRVESSSAVPGLNRETVYAINITIPSQQQVLNFLEIVTPLFDKTALNKKQNQQLASLRDWLLPMLMNGQVTITDGKH